MFFTRLQLLTIICLVPIVACRHSRVCDTVETGFQCNKDITHFWGPYTPYYSVKSTIKAKEHSCKVTFAQILSRHGARGPTLSQAKKIDSTLTKIQTNTIKYSEDFQFIQNFQDTLIPDELSKFGQQEMENSGIKFFNRYKDLARHEPIFIRSSSENRVVESAKNFTQGYCTKKHNGPSCQSNDKESPIPVIVLSEADGSNNTLNHGLCNAFENGPYSTIGDAAVANFTKVFASPITARLNSNLVGANLTDSDTINLMNLCTFETVAEATANPLSPLCHLFKDSEWKSYNYLQSLNKFYNFGPGNPLGSTQGVGFTNELIARLTSTSVIDHTSTNHTLDSSNITFPLGLKLYADFSHDNDMVGIMNALNLFNDVTFLSTTVQDDDSKFKVSELVPFSARVYVEKLECACEKEEFVRVMVNDRVMPLSSCGGDREGRCTLSKFIESLDFARRGGLWNQC